LAEIGMTVAAVLLNTAVIPREVGIKIRIGLVFNKRYFLKEN
jgi:hypothetical protein